MLDDHQLLPELLFELLEQVAAAGDDREAHALARERAGDAPADSHARAGDQRGASADAEVHFEERNPTGLRHGDCVRIACLALPADPPHLSHGDHDMKLKTAVAVAVAGAFALPLAAQASAEADRMILAQQSGSTMQPKDSNPAAPPRTLGPTTLQRRSQRLEHGAQHQRQQHGQHHRRRGRRRPAHRRQQRRRPRAEHAEGRSRRDRQGGFAGIDKNGDGHISRDEAKDATWENRFTELDKDNDNRLSHSEFDAMQAGAGAAGATGTTGAPVTSGTNAADRKPNTPKQ